MSRAQVHASPNFDEISSNNYEDIVFTLSFEPLAAVTLTFDLWPQNLVSTSVNVNSSTSVTKSWR